MHFEVKWSADVNFISFQTLTFEGVTSVRTYEKA